MGQHRAIMLRFVPFLFALILAACGGPAPAPMDTGAIPAPPVNRPNFWGGSRIQPTLRGVERMKRF